MVNFSARTEPFDFAGTPFDAAIHFGAPHWARAVCEYLMHEETVPVCSPTYRDRHNIRTPQDLDPRGAAAAKHPPHAVG